MKKIIDYLKYPAVFLTTILVPKITYAAYFIPDACSSIDPSGPAGTLGNGTEISAGKAIVYCFLNKTLLYIMGIAGLVLVIMIIIGGFLYMTSSGDPKKTTTARSALTAAVVGVIVVMLSWALVLYIGNILGGPVTPEITPG